MPQKSLPSIRKESTSRRKTTFFWGRNFPFHASEKKADSFSNVEEIICHHCWLLWKQVCCEKDKESQNHRIAEIGNEGTAGEGHPVHPPYSSWTTQSRLLSTMSRWASPTWETPKPLGNLCQSAVSLSMFWCSEGSSCVSVCAHCL